MDSRVGSDTPSEYFEEEGTERLADLLRVILKRLWFITLVAIVLVGLVVGYCFVQTPIYEASVKMLVAKPERVAPDQLSSEVQGLQQLTLTVVELINSRPVAEAVVRKLDLQTTPEDLLQSLSVEQVTSTSVIQITYQDPSPQRAQQVANAVGDEVFERASGGRFVVANITVSVWERATLPEDPVSPKFARNIGMALVVGVMLGVGLAFLLEHLMGRPKR